MAQLCKVIKAVQAKMLDLYLEGQPWNVSSHNFKAAASAALSLTGNTMRRAKGRYLTPGWLSGVPEDPNQKR